VKTPYLGVHQTGSRPERRPAERIEFANVIEKLAKLIEGTGQTNTVVVHLPDLKRELARQGREFCQKRQPFCFLMIKIRSDSLATGSFDIWNAIILNYVRFLPHTTAPSTERGA
jgi:hypothetical protein